MRSDVRVARDNMLKEANADLLYMQEERFVLLLFLRVHMAYWIFRVHHYNNLFALESRYANISRKMDGLLGSAVEASASICQHIQQTIVVHDRNASSRRMPESLFKGSMPSVFSKYL